MLNTQENTENRPLCKRKELWLLLPLALLLLLFSLPGKAAGAEAEIWHEEKELLRLPLEGSKAESFTLEELPGMRFGTDGKGGIAVLESDCPEQRCVASGYISRPGEFVCCLPRKVFICIKSPEADTDLVIGEACP